MMTVLTPEAGTTAEIQAMTLFIPRNKNARKGYIKVYISAGVPGEEGRGIGLAAAQCPYDVNFAVSGNQPSTPAMMSRHTHPHDLASWMSALRVTLGPDTPLGVRVDNFTDAPTEAGDVGILYIERAESTGESGGEDGGESGGGEA